MTAKPQKLFSFECSFYEHPTLGDESPLLVSKGNHYYYTDLFDMPDCHAEAFQAYEGATTCAHELGEVFEKKEKDNG